MPYTIKTVDVGDYKTTYIYAERPAATARGKRNKPTSDVQAKLNERMSEARFRDIVHLNFSDTDFALRLDYNKFMRKNGENPTVEQAHGRMAYYLRKLKKVYAIYGLELAYVYVTEVGVRSGKIHHHMILRGDADPSVRMFLRSEAERLWSYGYANSRKLEFSEDGLKGLIHYFIKEPSTARRWACSVGLKRPTEENGMITRRSGAISAKAAKHIDANPFDTDFIVKHAVGEGWVPSQVRVTAISAMEDAKPYEIPGVTDASINVHNGLVYPDYGGVFLEIWSYKKDTKLFTPIGEDKRVRKVSKTKQKNQKGGNCA